MKEQFGRSQVPVALRKASMRFALPLGVLTACLLAPGAYGEEKAQPAQIEELVKNLGHRKFTEREKAARALVALGEPALEALRSAAKSSDSEISIRAEALAARIERQEANRKLLRAPIVHVKFESVALRSALAEVTKKTGLNLQLDERRVANPNRTITLDTGDVPLWTAVDQFLEAAGLTEAQASGPLQPTDAERLLLNQPAQPLGNFVPWGSRPPSPQQLANRVLLVDGKHDAPSSTDSLVRVRALPRDFPGNVLTRGSGEISLTLDVTPAPSLSWRGLVGVEIRRAVDEHGQALTQSHVQEDVVDSNMMMWDGAMPVQVFRGGGLMVQGMWIDQGDGGLAALGDFRHVPVSLRSGQRSSKTLRQLEGVVTGRVLTPPQILLTVDSVLKADAKTVYRVDATTIQILEVKVQPNNTIMLRVKIDQPSPNDMAQFGVRIRGRMQPFIMMNQFDGSFPGNGPPQVALLDADGKPLRLMQNNYMNSSDNGLVMSSEMQFVFQQAKGQKDAAKLTLTGRRAIDLDVPFSLKNVPLP
jgi:hypothetical protein